MSTPELGADLPVALEEIQTTLVLAGGDDFAVSAKMGVSSLVNRNGATLLVPSWSSSPCLVLLPCGGIHDAGIVPENVETLLLAQEFFSGRFDRG